jgi:hypothetical protein
VESAKQSSDFINFFLVQTYAAPNQRSGRERFIPVRAGTGCATGVSEPGIVTVCPPVVEYSPEFQARAADELGPLPDGSAIAQMLSDYAMMREQARACLEPSSGPIPAYRF